MASNDSGIRQYVTKPAPKKKAKKKAAPKPQPQPQSQPQSQPSGSIPGLNNLPGTGAPQPAPSQAAPAPQPTKKPASKPASKSTGTPPKTGPNNNPNSGSGAQFLQNGQGGPSSVDSHLSTVSGLLGLDNNVLGDPSLMITVHGPTMSNLQSSKSAIELISNYMTMSPDDRRQLQQSLYNGGFYPADYYDARSGKKPMFGSTTDDGGLQALEVVLKNSALTGEPMDSILSKGTGAQTPGLSSLASLSVGGGNVYKVNTDDPNAVKSIVDKTAVSLLGRQLSDSERNNLVGQIIGNERTQQTQANSAEEAAQQSAFNSKLNAQNVQSATGAPPPTGTMDAQSIAQVAYNAGFRGEALTNIIAIGLAESGGNPTAHNPNASTGDDSYGIWQVNYYAGLRSGRTKTYGAPETQFDPQHAAQTAYAISGGGKKFSDWTTYTSGAYKKYLGSAGAAAQAVQANPQASAAPGGAPAAGGAMPTSPTPSPDGSSSAAPAAGPAYQGYYIPPTTINEQQVDPQADAEAQIKAQNPVEYQTYNTVRTFQSLLSMLGKPV